MSNPPTNEAPIESPPPMPQPAKEPIDRRVELKQMSDQLKAKSDRRTLSQFLRLRRALRS